jgi:hypothetical protein
MSHATEEWTEFPEDLPPPPPWDEREAVIAWVNRMYDARGNRDEYEFAMQRWDTVPDPPKGILEKRLQMAAERMERERAHSLVVEKVRAAVQRAKARKKPSFEALAEVMRDSLISRDLIATCLVERAKQSCQMANVGPIPLHMTLPTICP